jgi:hypothetical protein
VSARSERLSSAPQSQSSKSAKRRFLRLGATSRACPT